MKKSNYIQLPEACGFLEAASLANYNDMPWNCFITLHIEATGILPINASNHVRKGLNRLMRYHKRNNMPVSYGWVLENVATKGVHLHLLVHRPKDLPMHYMAYRWAILKRFKIKNDKGVLKVEKFRSHQDYYQNLYEVIDYSLKGLRDGTQSRFEDITGFRIRTPVNQGLIYGKRIGWSR